MKNNFEQNIKDNIQKNIQRMSENIDPDTAQYSKEIAEKTLYDNNKLISKYFEGRSALSDMVNYARSKAERQIDERLVGEWTVYLLNEDRLKKIKVNKQRRLDVIINIDEED